MEVGAVEIRIPKLGMEMTEATLAEWLVDDGATVEQDEPVYVLETDKVENEVGAPVAGVLRRIGVAGQTYTVGSVIGEIVGSTTGEIVRSTPGGRTRRHTSGPNMS